MSIQEPTLLDLYEELGSDFLPAAEKMMMQKYGVIPPQFTASEKNLILRDERQERGE